MSSEPQPVSSRVSHVLVGVPIIGFFLLIRQADLDRIPVSAPAITWPLPFIPRAKFLRGMSVARDEMTRN